MNGAERTRRKSAREFTIFVDFVMRRKSGIFNITWEVYKETISRDTSESYGDKSEVLYPFTRSWMQVFQFVSPDVE